MKVSKLTPDGLWIEMILTIIIVEPFTVPGEKLAIMNESSIEVPSRPGEQLVKLAVFHQLHCLVWLPLLPLNSAFAETNTLLF